MKIKIATAVSKQLIIIVFISIVMLAILGVSAYSSIKINEKLKNKKANAEKLYLVIEQYEVLNFNFKPRSEPIILFEAEFTDELYFDKIFKNEHGFNHVHIENGVAKVIDADCRDKRCMHDYITNGPRFFELQGIKCMPHGLLIKWKSEQNEN